MIKVIIIKIMIMSIFLDRNFVLSIPSVLMSLTISNMIITIDYRKSLFSKKS